jgi:hypothetical protein
MKVIAGSSRNVIIEPTATGLIMVMLGLGVSQHFVHASFLCLLLVWSCDNLHLVRHQTAEQFVKSCLEKWW